MELAQKVLLQDESDPGHKGSVDLFSSSLNVVHLYPQNSLEFII